MVSNSLITDDVLSTAFERYKNTFSKVIFNISCNKNKLETENIFLREETIVKKKLTIKKIRVGDLNLGTVGNRKHTFFCLALDFHNKPVSQSCAVRTSSLFGGPHVLSANTYMNEWRNCLKCITIDIHLLCLKTTSPLIHTIRHV